MPGIHVAVRRLGCGRVSVSGTRAGGLSARRSLRRRRSPLRSRVMLSGGGFVSVRNVGLTPLRGWARPLMGCAVRSCIGVIRLANALLAVGCRNGSGS